MRGFVQREPLEELAPVSVRVRCCALVLAELLRRHAESLSDVRLRPEALSGAGDQVTNPRPGDHVIRLVEPTLIRRQITHAGEPEPTIAFQMADGHVLYVGMSEAAAVKLYVLLQCMLRPRPWDAWDPDVETP